MRQSIVISIPSVWSIRNFIYSEFRDRIEETYSVYYLVPKVSSLQKFFDTRDCNVIYYSIERFSAFEDILYLALKYKSIRIPTLRHNHNFFKTYLKPSKSIKAKVKDTMGWLVSLLLSADQIENCVLSLSATDDLKRLAEKIQEIRPQFVLATNHIVKYEIKIFSFFQKLRMPTRLYVNSFDNLTSRGLLPLSHFDQYYVWNSKMTTELTDFYNLPSSKVHAVSTPQFDLIKEGSNEKLDPTDVLYETVEGSDYLLYSTGHFSLLPEEPRIVELLINTLLNDAELCRLKFVVRPHPMEKYERWSQLAQRYKNVLIDYPWEQDPQNVNWAVPSEYEFKRLGRVLGRARIVFNIASTITLDCCILNKPIINISFGINEEDERMVQNYYHLDHYKDITAANCAPRIDRPEKLISYVNLLLRNPLEYSENRVKVRSMISNYCDDRSASERLVKHLQPISN